LGQGGDNAAYHCNCNQQESDLSHNGSSFVTNLICHLFIQMHVYWKRIEIIFSIHRNNLRAYLLGKVLLYESQDLIIARERSNTFATICPIYPFRKLAVSSHPLVIPRLCRIGRLLRPIFLLRQSGTHFNGGHLIKRSLPTCRARNPQREEPTKPRTNAAISSAAVSSAK
jgi:hypothetical protein